MGLEHTLSLLDFLNNPQEGIKTIHIAGTNGKGSTGATIYSILREYGYKVGLYTSPHLIKFNERIRINGRFISDEEIMSFMRYVQPSINEIKSTFFEVTTAMAFNHFNEKNVDIAIIETGLGGRLDSTNVVNPVLTVMTPISFDHIDILGDTIEKIAAEKAGIVKDRVPLITAKQLEEVFNILKRKANGKKATIDTPSDPIDIKLGLNGTGFKLGGRIFLTSLIGNHQAERVETVEMERGIQIAEWFLDESMKLNTTINTPKSNQDAEKLLAWLKIRQKSSTQPITPRELSQDGPNSLRGKTKRDEVLKILEEPSDEELYYLSMIKYQQNIAYLHSDLNFMPKLKKVWSSWNYIQRGKKNLNNLCVTYWMNKLQNLNTEEQIFVTLNTHPIFNIKNVYKKIIYSHPIYDKETITAQKGIKNIQGIKNTWFCGAYQGNGFHEDGIKSGLNIAEKISKYRRPWKK